MGAVTTTEKFAFQQSPKYRQRRCIVRRWRQTVPHARTGDAECTVARGSPSCPRDVQSVWPRPRIVASGHSRPARPFQHKIECSGKRYGQSFYNRNSYVFCPVAPLSTFQGKTGRRCPPPPWKKLSSWDFGLGGGLRCISALYSHISFVVNRPADTGCVHLRGEC